MTVLDLSKFVEPLNSCDTVLTAGSGVYLSPLPGCQTTPTEYYFTVDQVGISVPNQTFQVRLSPTTPTSYVGDSPAAQITLRKGHIIYFDSPSVVVAVNKIEVAQDTVVSTSAATTVNVKTLTPAQVTYFGTARNAQMIYETSPLLSTMDMPVNFNDTVQDTTDTSNNLQASSTITSQELQTNFGFRLRCDDSAMHNIMLPSQTNAHPCFALYSQGGILTCATLIMGRVLVSGTNMSAAIKDFIKGQTNLLWQPPYAVIYKYDNIPTATAKVNYVRGVRAMGLPNRI
jgi:hypothetical protein